MSYAQGLQIGLEAEGIPATVLDQNAPGYLGFAGRVRLVILADDDYDRAMVFVRQFEDRPQAVVAPPSWRVQRWGLLIGACGFVVLFGALGVSADGPNLAAYLIFAAGIVLMFTGVTLVLIVGPRRDRHSNRGMPPPN